MSDEVDDFDMQERMERTALIEELRAENEEMRRTFGSHPLFKEKDDEIERLADERDTWHYASIAVADELKIYGEEIELLRARCDAMLAALKTCACPRPANQAPIDTTVEQCMMRDECGCDCGAAIREAGG